MYKDVHWDFSEAVKYCKQSKSHGWMYLSELGQETDCWCGPCMPASQDTKKGGKGGK